MVSLLHLLAFPRPLAAEVDVVAVTNRAIRVLLAVSLAWGLWAGRAGVGGEVADFRRGAVGVVPAAVGDSLVLTLLVASTFVFSAGIAIIASVIGLSAAAGEGLVGALPIVAVVGGATVLVIALAV
jgi:hypothetical protein